MNKKNGHSGVKPATSTPKSADQRKQREAEALRRNLARRKAAIKPKQ